MSVILWLAGCVLFAFVFAWALCRAAANGDILAAATYDDPADADDRLCEVIHFPHERRQRSHARNGIGTGPAA